MGAIAGAEGVSRLSFGILDLMLDMGVAPDTPAAAILLNQERFNIRLQSRVHGLNAPIDSVYPNFSDTSGLAAAARLACDMGFGGMLCIHPAQVDVVHKAFAPSSQELDWATRVVSQAETSGSRSEEHTSELQSLKRISYAVFCLK